MEGNYKTAHVLVKVAVPAYYDKSEANTKTESCVYRALSNESAGFAPHGKVISIYVKPNEELADYAVFQFELGLDIAEIIDDLPEEKRKQIIDFIDNYKPRR